MSEAEVTFCVRELHAGYFAYDVHVRPTDGLPMVRQAGGAFHCEHLAELACARAIGEVGVKLASMGASPLPVRRIGDSPRDRRRRARAHELGVSAALALCGLVVLLGAWAIGKLAIAVW